MGGAATVCIQYEDGTRDSYMAYNRGMAILLNHSEILTAPDGERDAIARELFSRERGFYDDDYFTDYPGLAPEWYGLNFMDLKRKRIWWNQGQNNIPVYYVASLIHDYAPDYRENLARLAELGYVHLREHKVMNFNEAQEPNNIIACELPIATVEQVEFLTKNDIHAVDKMFNGFASFNVFVPDWDYGNFHGDFKKMYEMIKADYDLTDDEEKRWQAYLKFKHGDDEDE